MTITASASAYPMHWLNRKRLAKLIDLVGD
jgi:hypothetical protein